MNEERNRRIYKFLREYVNFGTKNEITDEGRLIAAVGLLISESVFTFKELQFECAMKVHALYQTIGKRGPSYERMRILHPLPAERCGRKALLLLRSDRPAAELLSEKG